MAIRPSSQARNISPIIIPPSIRSARPDHSCSLHTFPITPSVFFVMGAYVQPREKETGRKKGSPSTWTEKWTMVVVVAQCYVGCNSTSDADKRNKTAEETKKKLDRGLVAETPC